MNIYLLVIFTRFSIIIQQHTHIRMNKSSIDELKDNNEQLLTLNKSRFKELKIIIDNKNDYVRKYEDLVKKNTAINKKCVTISNEIEKIKAETNAIKEKLLAKHNELFTMKANRDALQVEYEAIKTERDKALSELNAVEVEAEFNGIKVKHRNCDIL